MTNLEKLQYNQQYMQDSITNAKNFVNGYYNERKKIFQYQPVPPKVREAIVFLCNYA